MPNSVPVRYTSPRISTRNTHGTGCTFSSAIASYLALGHRLTDAVSLAKKYLTQALQTGADITIGSGHGSVNHFFAPRVLTPLNPIEGTAIAIDNKLVPKNEWNDRILTDGNKITIIRATFGG